MTTIGHWMLVLDDITVVKRRGRIVLSEEDWKRIEHAYIVDRLHYKIIAEYIGVSVSFVFTNLRKRGVNLRSPYEENFHRRYGARSKTRGYIRKFVPDHPCAAIDGWVMEHRFLVEAWLREHDPTHPSLDEKGYLRNDWVVHHKNGVKYDNRIENLEPLPRNQHHPWLHYREELVALRKRVAELEARLAMHEGSNSINGTDN